MVELTMNLVGMLIKCADIKFCHTISTHHVNTQRLAQGEMYISIDLAPNVKEENRVTEVDSCMDECDINNYNTVA